MKEMKKTKLAAALAATIGLGAFTGSAQAVNMAPDGVGEVLYFPYYVVSDGQENHLQLINTSDKTVAVKLMFREGEGSEDVRDFHIIMSPRDVWNGFVRHDGLNNAKVVTSDRTCTVPDKPAWTPEVGRDTFSVSFSTVNINGEELRPREGYAVALVMGVSDIPTSRVDSVPYLAKHVDTGDNNWVPRDCASIDWAFSNADGFESVKGQFDEPENVLAGSMVLVNSLEGRAANVPVTALANFRNFTDDIIGLAGSTLPNESFVFPKEATVFDGVQARLYEADFDGVAQGAGAAAVTAALMRDSVQGQFDTTEVRTSWVLNFPTKRFHSIDDGVDNEQPFPPLIEVDGEKVIWVDISPLAETLIDPTAFGNQFTAFTNFEESEGIIPSNTSFSPAIPIIETGVVLPWEVNVITFDNRNLLNSNLVTNLDLSQPEGWMEMRFTNSRPLVGDSLNDEDRVVFHGLPVIGFNFNLEGTINGLAAGIPFSYTRAIEEIE